MDIESCIFFQLANAGKAGTRYWRDRVAPFGVTSVQALILVSLTARDQVTAKELGQAVRLDSATLTGTLDRMVKAGLLERRTDAEDRRAISICLTPDGRKTGKDISAIVADANRDFLKRLSPAEALMLKELLHKLHA